MFNKPCPDCNKSIEYKTKSQYNDSVKNKRVCKSCSNIRRKKHNVYIKACIVCGILSTFRNLQHFARSKPQQNYLCKPCAIKQTHKGKVISTEHRKLIGKTNTGRFWSQDRRLEYSKSVSGKNNPMYGKIRHDLRIKWLNSLIQSGIKPRTFYNPYACKAIDEYGKLYGYRFQHALNGGEFYIKELGYFVDGYDAEQNVVIEYDEKYHNTTRQKEKDIERQRLITEHLGCTFIRIS